MCLIFIFNELALKADLEKFNYKQALQIYTFTMHRFKPPADTGFTWSGMKNIYIDVMLRILGWIQQSRCRIRLAILKFSFY